MHPFATPLRLFTAAACLLVCAFCHTLRAQLDTLHFDDFSDNRHGWRLWDDESGRSEIRDGYLEIVLRQRKGRYNIRTFQAEVTEADTFVYEIAMEVDQIRYAGAVYEYSTNKKGRMGEYVAFGALTDEAYGYRYTSANNRIYFNWRVKTPDLYQPRMVFRVAYGSGHYHLYLNGRFLKRVQAPSRPVWKYWGWVIKGYARLKIDYVLLLKG